MTNKKLHIYIHAYFDNNIGDDLMIKGLIKAYPEHQFYATSVNSSVINTYENSNLIFITRKELRKNITSFDVYLKIGGSIFQYNNSMGTFRKYLESKLFKSFKRKGLKLVVLGSNLGPFKTKQSKSVAKKEIKLYDLITVRDKASYSIIKEEFKLSNVRLYDDIGFEVIKKEDFHSVRSTEELNLGVSVYRSVYDQKINQPLYEGLSETIINLCEKNEINSINLFAFDSEGENDLSAAHHIEYLLSDKINVKINIIPYLGSNFDSFIKEFNSMNYFIALRFHSAILSDIFEIPYLPIAYSNKLLEYVKDNGSHSSLLDISDFTSELKMDFNLEDFKFRTNSIANGHFESLNEVLKTIE